LTVGKKLYVGNLTYRVSSSDLEQLFSQFGSVESAEVISDRDTGRSKGFGFVEMSSDNEARAAIDALNEQEHDGRRLTVNEARPREPRTGGGGGGGGGGGWRGGGNGGGDGGRGRSSGGYDNRRY
jgi:RNA recognition motif-containing protein